MIKQTSKQRVVETEKQIIKPIFSCCPTNNTYHFNSNLNNTTAFKKGKKFINMTLASSKTSENPSLSQINETVKKKQGKVVHIKPQNKYESDKYNFLQSLRKFNPNPQNEKELFSEQSMREQKEKTQNQSYLQQQNNDNQLSSILDTLSNEMFSEMFVSGEIRHKIQFASRQLKSISEVKSEMEMSNKTISGVCYSRTSVIEQQED